MKQIELLTVEKTQELELGTVLFPSFPVPEHKNWGAGFEIWMVAPSGETSHYLAHFMQWNVSIAAPSTRKRLPPKIALTIPNVPKNSIELGSRVLVEEHTHWFLFGGSDA